MRPKITLTAYISFLAACVVFIGYFFFLDSLIYAQSFTGAHNAFIKLSNLPVEDSLDAQTRAQVNEYCGPVASEKLAITTANQILSSVTGKLAGLSGSDLVKVAAELVSNAATDNLEAPHLTPCLAALAIYRKHFPNTWKMMNDSTTFPRHPLTRVDELIERLTKT